MSGIARRRAAAAADADNKPAYQERVETIRRAAGRVFHQRGFHATKLNDIAAEAGVDRASLYYYVGSKEQLFRDVVSEAVTANIAATKQIVESELPASEKLVQIIRELMGSFENYYPYMYVFVQEDFVKLDDQAVGDSEWLATVRDWNSSYFRLVRGVINEGLGDGDLRSPLPAGIVANCLIGMMNYSNLWFRPEGLLDAEEIARGMARLVLDGLRAGN
jgi:TetR/AcrR family transcriptional regulator, cholesterol catabolism regulator